AISEMKRSAGAVRAELEQREVATVRGPSPAALEDISDNCCTSWVQEIISGSKRRCHRRRISARDRQGQWVEVTAAPASARDDRVRSQEFELPVTIWKQRHDRGE